MSPMTHTTHPIPPGYEVYREGWLWRADVVDDDHRMTIYRGRWESQAVTAARENARRTHEETEPTNESVENTVDTGAAGG